MRNALAVIFLLAAMLNARADFADDFQAAKKSFDQREYEQARQAFEALAAKAPNEKGEAAARSCAAIALGRLKQVDEAVEMARTIKDQPLASLTLMEILSDNKRHKELLATFKDENIAVWPDSLNYRGLFLRGAAHQAAGDRRLAVADLTSCADLAGSDLWVKLEALGSTAGLCAELGDEDQAMALYEQAIALYDASPGRKGRWLYPNTLLGAARIRLKQQRHEDALAILAKADDIPNRARGVWDFLILEARGDVYLAQGRKGEALTKYQEAAGIKTHQSYTDRVSKKIQDLGAQP